MFWVTNIRWQKTPLRHFPNNIFSTMIQSSAHSAFAIGRVDRSIFQLKSDISRYEPCRKNPKLFSADFLKSCLEAAINLFVRPFFGFIGFFCKLECEKVETTALFLSYVIHHAEIDKR